MLIACRRLIEDYKVRPDGVLHVGAHLAEERFAYTRHGFGHVWWVEANPDLISPLVGALSATSRLVRDNTVIHACVGDIDGDTATLRVANNGQSSSVLDLAEHAVEHPEVVYTGETHRLTVRTIDSLVAEHDIDADFLNLDIQGHELAALQGAERFLATANWVYTEVNARELYAGCAFMPEITEFLRERGFEMAACEMTNHGWGDALYERQR